MDTKSNTFQIYTTPAIYTQQLAHKGDYRVDLLIKIICVMLFIVLVPLISIQLDPTMISHNVIQNGDTISEQDSTQNIYSCSFNCVKYPFVECYPKFTTNRIPYTISKCALFYLERQGN